MNSSLTIVHVSTASDWYGGENQCFLLARGLRGLGHRCVMFARADGEARGRFEQAGLEVVPLTARARTPWEMWRVYREIRKLRPDVVHTHDPHAVLSGGVAIRSLNCVRIFTRRNAYPIQFLRKYTWGCDRMVAISTAVEQVCLESGFPAERLEIIPSGVDRQRIEAGERSRGRASLAVPAEQQVALQVGSLLDSKGHIDTLQALARVKEEFPCLHLFLAGNGPLEASLREFTQQAGLTDRVTFLGYRKDIPDLLAAADLVLMPSRVEALGTSAIDAMLAERPLIASTAGGLPEVLGERPGEPAVATLVPPASPVELARAIRQTLLTLPEAQRIARLARERAIREYTAESMVAGNLHLYEKCLQSQFRQDQKTKRAA